MKFKGFDGFAVEIYDKGKWKETRRFKSITDLMFHITAGGVHPWLNYRIATADKDGVIIDYIDGKNMKTMGRNHIIERRNAL